MKIATFNILIFLLFLSASTWGNIHTSQFLTQNRIEHINDTLKKNILDTVDISGNQQTIIVDSLKRKMFPTAYDLLKSNPDLRFEDDGIYYRGKLLTTIKINGQVFNFISLIELLKIFPSSILSAYNLNPHTDLMNKFWGNENKDINSIDLRTPNGKITGLLGNSSLRYSFKSKFELNGNIIYFKNNNNTLIDINLNNNSFNWATVIDNNLDKAINGKISIQNNTKLRNGEFSFKLSYSRNNTISKDQFIDSFSVIKDTINNKTVDRIQENLSRSIHINSSLKKTFNKLYLDASLNVQKENWRNTKSNSNNNKKFLSNNTSQTDGYTGSFNIIYKLYKNNIFLSTNTTIGQNTSQKQNYYQNDTIYNEVLSQSKSHFVQSRAALKFNFKKVFIGDIYYNIVNSNANSQNTINVKKNVDSKLKQHNQNVGTTIRFTKSSIDFSSNIYYEKAINTFKSDSNKNFLDNNSGLLYNSSLTLRALNSRLNNVFTFQKSLIYPTLSQKDPTHVNISDNYSSIGNPNVTNQSIFNFNWNTNYQMKNSDNINLTISTSLNKNKIIENLFVLKNDTVIYEIKFNEGTKMLTNSNSNNTNSPNSSLSLAYTKNNFIVTNLSLQNSLSYTTAQTERSINSKDFTDKSDNYLANINAFYYKDRFSANLNYGIAFSNYKFTNMEENFLDSSIKNINQTIAANVKINYFKLVKLEISNQFNTTNSNGILIKNNRTDIILSQSYFNSNLDISLNIFDAFDQMKQEKIIKNDFLITRESKTNMIGRYFLLTLAYKFQKLKS
ncbi:hypothetical protein ACR780_16530 [Sphingobacterium faecium]|uniref:hypothetical protein n=1 Tax=Sphingobacterium faecium TaxID=34087 RepID=UPI003DA247CB